MWWYTWLRGGLGVWLFWLVVLFVVFWRFRWLDALSGLLCCGLFVGLLPYFVLFISHDLRYWVVCWLYLRCSLRLG